jgi:hypothetical protein
MIDVVIAGAGPAGCIAGIVLVRAGVRVLMLDRARFPRPKLCGDSLNPGAVALLDRFELTGFPEERAVPADGMIVTGEAGVRIEGRYPPGVRGRFISRTDLDSWLLEQALSAGVEVQERARVVGAVLSDGVRGREVTGVRVARAPRGECTLASRLTIAADGRRSALAFGLGLARHPARPRRWAVGGYFEGVNGLSSLGEMHIRAGSYIGVAPLPGGIANACLVTHRIAGLRGHHDLGAVLSVQIARDPILGPRFASARPVTRPVALGPLAVDASGAWRAATTRRSSRCCWWNSRTCRASCGGNSARRRECHRSKDRRSHTACLKTGGPTELDQRLRPAFARLIARELRRGLAIAGRCVKRPAKAG